MANLRNRARDLVRNNPYAARALDVRVANTIGTGIVAEVQSPKLRSFWDAFVDECDADRHNDLFGVEALIERVRSESGEALVHFVPSDSRTKVPIQVRVLEPDFIDESRYGKLENGNEIRYGIEYGSLGQVEAYWLYPEHPGERTLMGVRSLVSRRIPSSEILHVFRKMRAGQTRGVTDFAPVMVRMRDLDDYDDAEVMRKKIEACLAAFVTSPQGNDAGSLGPISTDGEGRVEQLYPAMIQYLKPGEGVTFSDPKASGGYADFERFGLRAVAAGYGVPYELMTGDLSQVNYSSYRAGLVDFRRRVEQDQWQLHVPRVCTPIFKRFLAEVVPFRPNLPRDPAVTWTPPRFELIDPLKETEAELEACLAGFDTWDEIVRRRGWTASEQMDTIEAWQKELDKRGIVLKSDPRVGTQPKAATPAPEEPTDPDENEVMDDEEAA